MTERILLTGASGLIGRQVAALLKADGHHVIEVSRNPPGAGAAGGVTCDLLEPESRRLMLKKAQATHLIHLAWHDLPSERWSSPKNHAWATATVDLLREFSRSGGERAVFVGSCAEYDWSTPLLSERTPLRPRSVYGAAKARAFEQCIASSLELDISFAWGRVFFCYGPGEPQGRLIGDLLHGLASGKRVACTNGLAERDFMHTRDVARGLLSVLKTDLVGPVNIASGGATAVREIIQRAAQLMKGEHLIEWGAIERPIDDPPRLVADVDLLASTGFRPSIDLESGILECITKMNRSFS